MKIFYLVSLFVSCLLILRSAVKIIRSPDNDMNAPRIYAVFFLSLGAFAGILLTSFVDAILYVIRQ